MGKLQVLMEKRQVTANFNFWEYFYFYFLLFSPTSFSSSLHFEWHLSALCLCNFSLTNKSIQIIYNEKLNCLNNETKKIIE